MFPQKILTEQTTTKPPTSEDSSTIMVSSSPITEIITKNEVTNEKSTTQEINADDYPSAINQGQLFTIIENGKFLYKIP